MRLLVFGESGQVATELARLPIDAKFLSRNDADLRDPVAAAAKIGPHAPDAVINAAAWTDVDGAETNADDAHLINATAPGEIAKACATLNIPLVQISTDYVFNGLGTEAFMPEDEVGPLGVYGASKLAGERGVAAAGCPYAVLRTSWVFSAHGKNFVKTMLRLSEARDKLNVVADQVGGPTSARSIAEACVAIAAGLAGDPAKSGDYHFSGGPNVSWADFARAIFATSGRNVLVNDITTEEFPTPAKRPLNSRMDCSSTSDVFGIERPDWQRDLQKVIRDLETQK